MSSNQQNRFRISFMISPPVLDWRNGQQYFWRVRPLSVVLLSLCIASPAAQIGLPAGSALEAFVPRGLRVSRERNMRGSRKRQNRFFEGEGCCRMPNSATALFLRFLDGEDHSKFMARNTSLLVIHNTQNKEEQSCDSMCRYQFLGDFPTANLTSEIVL